MLPLVYEYSFVEIKKGFGGRVCGKLIYLKYYNKLMDSEHLAIANMKAEVSF